MPESNVHAADYAAARERLQRVFRYLQELHELRSPVPRQMDRYTFVQWIHDLPEHPTVSFIGTQEIHETESDEGESAPDGYVLRVRRPDLTDPPSPPEIVREWVTRWTNPESEPNVRPTMEVVGDSGETRTTAFRDNPMRSATWSRYLEAWRKWAGTERPTRRAARLFERLFSLYTTLQREGEHLELVLGDGILAWQRNPDPVQHPLLLQSLQLEFDPGVPEFTLVETDKGVEFYSAVFRSIPEASPSWLNSIRTELEEQGFHPLGGESTSEFLKRLVGRLSPHGRFEPDGHGLRPPDQPVIGRAPVIFARNRSQGFAAFIEHTLEHLANGGKIPPILGNVVGVPLNGNDEPREVRLTRPGEEPESILFSKPANPEQVLAAEYLDAVDGVLVQGPPGTGKTHTIANLLGHLLASGQSVLVTSHASKALRVLRDKVVEPLRPLCVSVLDSHSRSQNELEHAVQTIVSRLGASDPTRLVREAEQYSKQREDLLSQIRQRRSELIRARAGEYDDLVVDGQRYAPSDAAREVAAGRGVHDWIPSPVPASQPLPLSIDELAELYRTNTEIPAEEEPEIREDLPELHVLPSPTDFRSLLDGLDEAARAAEADRPEFWQSPPREGDDGRTTAVSTSIENAIAPLSDKVQWPLAVVAAGMRGEADEKPWRDLLQRIETVVELARDVQPKILEFGPELPAEPALEEQSAVLEQILEHLESGGQLSRLKLLVRPKWKTLLQACRVDGREPRSTEHVEALLGLVRLRLDREALCRRWDRQMKPLGGPAAESLAPEPERAAQQFADRIVQLLEWSVDTWQPAQVQLQEIGFRWDEFIRDQPPRTEEYGELIRLRDACRNAVIPLLRARAAAARHLSLEEELRRVANVLAPFAHARVVDRFRDAVRKRDGDRYESAYRRLAELWRYKLILNKRTTLLSRLSEAAPDWARSIAQRTPPHDSGEIPGDANMAWRWRQFNDELDRRAAADPDAINEQLDKLRSRLHEVTAQLIERRTWAQQHARTGLAERQALMGYRDAVKRIGRGTGKRAPIFRAQAQKLMSKCRTAVPVWIMPLSRAVDTFDPRTTRFDVVIIDEASQSDVMGLLAFFLADRVLVVGDDEQVSPSAVGQNVTAVHRLIEEHLAGIPNHRLYDGQMSVYELAQQSFTRNLRLVEHFRCVPDIIEFSNHLSYQGEVTPLRDASDVVLQPHVIEHSIAHGYEERKVNHAEAHEVASLLIAAVEQPEYRDKTFGVISLLGDEQALLIEKRLRDHLPPRVIEEHKVLCGNAAQFQGDERDVVFLSMVKTRTPDGGPLALMGDGYLKSNKKRFNVAASRAKDQMWVVHSLNPATDLKHGDLRLRLIQHARNPNAVVELTRRAQSRAESELERRVIAHLVRRGFRLTPQWWVGYYRIDLVVHGPDGTKVAVECDGDRYHPHEKLEEDLARQAVLERLGWRFVRIRGSEFFRDPESTMERVAARLKALDILPATDASPARSATSDLLDRVRRRAAELRREWGVDDAPECQQEAIDDIEEAVEDLLALRPEPNSAGEPPLALTPAAEDSLSATEAEADQDGGQTLDCPICLKSDRQLVLYRGKEICTECAELLAKDATTVPARASRPE